MGNIGVKVSAKDIDVKDPFMRFGYPPAHVPAKFHGLLFDSEYYFLKNEKEGAGSFVIPQRYEYTGDSWSVSIPHNLGYRPGVVLYWSLDNVNWYPASERNTAFQDNISCYAYSDPVNIVVFGVSWPTQYPPTTVYYKYVIYVDEQ